LTFKNSHKDDHGLYILKFKKTVATHGHSTSSFKDVSMRKLVAVGITALLWTLWKIRNKASFQNIFPVDLDIIMFSVSHMISTWAILQKKGLRSRQCAGARVLLDVASKVFNKSQGWGPVTKRLGN
jgi:hypothetical protein